MPPRWSRRCRRSGCWVADPLAPPAPPAPSDLSVPEGAPPDDHRRLPPRARDGDPRIRNARAAAPGHRQAARRSHADDRHAVPPLRPRADRAARPHRRLPPRRPRRRRAGDAGRRAPAAAGDRLRPLEVPERPGRHPHHPEAPERIGRAALRRPRRRARRSTPTSGTTDRTSWRSAPTSPRSCATRTSSARRCARATSRRRRGRARGPGGRPRRGRDNDGAGPAPPLLSPRNSKPSCKLRTPALVDAFARGRRANSSCRRARGRCWPTAATAS